MFHHFLVALIALAAIAASSAKAPPPALVDGREGSLPQTKGDFTLARLDWIDLRAGGRTESGTPERRRACAGRTPCVVAELILSSASEPISSADLKLKLHDVREQTYSPIAATLPRRLRPGKAHSIAFAVPERTAVVALAVDGALFPARCIGSLTDVFPREELDE